VGGRLLFKHHLVAALPQKIDHAAHRLGDAVGIRAHDQCDRLKTVVAVIKISALG
jgi:hypothetical protein